MNNVPKDLEKIIAEIISYNDLNNITEDEYEKIRERLYVELPMYYPEDNNEYENWKIEISL